MLDGERVAGCCALLTNDLISRQDLWPWLACLYVEPDYRGGLWAPRYWNMAQGRQKEWVTAPYT